jgi:hypothetical protein
MSGGFKKMPCCLIVLHIASKIVEIIVDFLQRKAEGRGQKAEGKKYQLKL